MAPDTEDELFGDSARVVRATSMVVMRAVEQVNRSREERSRREADGYRAAAAALEQRERAQQEAMRAIISPARDSQWRDNASDLDLATAYVYAEAYADQDPHARIIRDQIGSDLSKRHGDVAAFIDASVSSEQIESVPVPAGADLTPTQARLVAARDNRAEQWANIVEVQGEAEAKQWLVHNLDEKEKARLHAVNLEDGAGADRSEASQERTEEQDPSLNDSERDAAGERAEDLETEAAQKDSDAIIERQGEGRHPHDPHTPEGLDEDTMEALRVAQGGREQPLTEQLAEHRGRGEGPRRRARVTQARERDSELGR